MSEESNARLLGAYRAAVEAKQHGIADMLEDVILELMEGERTSPIVIGGSRTTTEPPWNVTYATDTVPLSTSMECTGIDPTAKEVPHDRH